MFDLEKSISAWLRMLEHSRALLAEDLEELECHLRDHIDAQVADGISQEEAFRKATHRLGDTFGIVAEYRKMFWTKARHQRRLWQEFLWEVTMLRNYLITAFRNLRKQGGYAAINVAGLGLGLTCCILLINLVISERSYDTFHEKGDRIHRVIVSYKGSLGGATPAPLAPTIHQVIPEIEHATRILNGSAVVGNEEELFDESILFVDASFLDLFTFSLLYGDPNDALTAPDRVVISEAMATKYFGQGVALGKTLQMRIGGRSELYTVAGILAPIPENSSLQFDFLVPFQKSTYVFGTDFLEDWGGYDPNTLILLSDNELAPQVEAKFAAFISENFGAMLAQSGLTTDDYKLVLQPYLAYHLGDVRGGNGLSPTGSPTTLYILFGIALAILLIACFNFMNLSLGRSSVRFMEVGIRKVLGAQRGQLMKQFLLEALLLGVLAIGLGMVLAVWLQPTFNTLVGRSLTLNYAVNGGLIVALLVLLVLVSLIAGGYPALVLSRFRPIAIFKGQFKLGGKNLFTKSLVTIQFVLSITLIVCTVFMAQQLRFVAEKSLGYEREAIVVIPTRANPTNLEQGDRTFAQFKQALDGHTAIVSVSAISTSFGRGSSSTDVRLEDRDIRVFQYRIDPSLFDMMNLEMKEGRAFSEDLPSDLTSAIVVNERFAQEFDLTAPSGTVFTSFESSVIPTDPTIIGVTKDFHFQSLRRHIGPAVFHLGKKMPFRHILVKINPEDFASTLALLQRTWQSINPDLPFQYSFLDDDLNRQYQAEQRWERLITYSALMAIFIACLGLFGLSAFAAERRTKEIGIRKALGANVGNIVLLLSKEFTVLIVLAFILAVPIGYAVMNNWLEVFVYRIDLGVGPFLLAGGLTLLIAWLTVSYQSLKAGLVNPVDTLRYE